MNPIRHRTPHVFTSEPPREDQLFDYAAIGDHIGYVLRSAKRHKLLFAGCVLAVVAAAAALAMVVPKQYQITASLLARRAPVMDVFSNPGVNRDWDAPARAAGEVVMRRKNLVALCAKTNFVERHLASRSPMGLAREWVRNKVGRPLTAEEILDGVVDGIEEKTWVTVGQEGTVTIGFQWSNPQLAYDFVQAALESFLQARHEAEVSSVRETIAILEAHDARVQKEAVELAVRLEEKERALRPRGGGVRRALPDPAPAPAAGADDELQRLEATLALKQRALVDFEESQRRRLADMHGRLAEQLNVYAPEHPLIEETRRTIEALQGPNPQLAALQAEVKALEAEARRRGVSRPAGTSASLLQSLALSAPPDLSATADPRLEYDRNQLGALLRQHANLLDRIAAARVEIDTAEAAFKYRYSVISPPQMPKGPVKNLPVLLVAAGLVGGVLVGLFATTLTDIRRGLVIEAWQIERTMGVTVLTKIER
ncbi:MAG: hypothetical protein QM767_01345 [Anaeromyxobacter sp.]